MIRFFIFLTIVVLSSAFAPGCQHPIFCNEKILTQVAKSNYFKDSKTFVDLVLKVPISEALNQFNTQPLTNFLQNCFINSSSILEPIQLSDWKPSPNFLSQIKNINLKDYATDLNKRWSQLSRKVNLNYTSNCASQCSSFLPNMDGRTIVVPGGRFQQSYYWDTYWIIKGLIVCDMLDTAQTLIQNFVLVISKYGFIPNGFRIYYLNRSQPPFFALMVKQLVQAFFKKGLKSKAENVEKLAFPALVQQHEFFMTSHSKTYRLKSSKQILLNYYHANTTTPRPESYKQDLKLIQNITILQKKNYILKSISTMAQSGWDFSSRWLQNVTDLKTSVILDMFPSDLNTLLGLSQFYLSTLAIKYNRPDLFSYYQKLLNDRKQYFMQKFNGKYFPDNSPLKQRKQNEVYPSDFYPFILFTQKQADVKGIYIDLINPVTSIFNNGMQWDKPNVWAPNNWILHQVLSDRDAYKIAQQWVQTTYCSWKKTGFIYQKYRSDKLGERGQGGQYTVQTGFGWTNGLALYYLQLYGDQFNAPDCR